jgi:uncharacterized protein
MRQTFTMLFACILATGCATRPQADRGPSESYREAAESYRKPAEQGSVLAQEFLGYAYEKGRGVVKDYAEAVHWYRKAAEHSGKAAASAQYRLAECYRDGRGVEQDPIEAYKWFNIAAANDFSPAIVYREQIAHTMTPQEIAEGQRLAFDFVAKEKVE